MTNNGGKHTLIFSSEQTAYWHYNPITPASLMLIYRLEPDRSVCSTFILYCRVSVVFLTWSHLSREYEMGNIKKQIISCFVFLFACIYKCFVPLLHLCCYHAVFSKFDSVFLLYFNASLKLSFLAAGLQL